MASPAPGQVAARAGSSRVEALDGLRGLLLLMMTTTHLTFAGGLALKHLHPDVYTFIDGAYGFVLLSGLVVGLTYGRTMLKHGVAVGTRKLWARALQLYAYAGALLVALTLAALFVPGFAAACADWLGPLAAPSASVIGAELLLLQQADYADILAPYIVYLAAAPLALWACNAGRWRSLAAVSAGLWIAAQLGAAVPLTAALDDALHRLRPDLHVPTEFNMLAWQLLFFAGLIFGAETANGRLDLERLFPRRPPLLFWTCVLGFGLLAALILTINHGPAATAQSLGETFAGPAGKPRLAWLGLLNLVVVAYPVGWLLARGATADTALRLAAQGLRWVLCNPYLRLLGRHSLQVYVWHVLLVYVVRLLDVSLGPFGEATKVAMALAVFALLALPALWRERRRLTARPQPAMAS